MQAIPWPSPPSWNGTFKSSFPTFVNKSASLSFAFLPADCFAPLKVGKYRPRNSNNTNRLNGTFDKRKSWKRMRKNSWNWQFNQIHQALTLLWKKLFLFLGKFPSGRENLNVLAWLTCLLVCTLAAFFYGSNYRELTSIIITPLIYWILTWVDWVQVKSSHHYPPFA